ncbi:hypothetical protein SGPA1_10829 [Streptomyces misionensis JCM 4497]
MGPGDGHAGGLRDLGPGRSGGARLRTAVRLHPPRLRRARPLADHRLVRVGLLLRRPLPGHVQAHPGPRRRQGPPRPAAAVHAARPGDPRTGAAEPGRGGPEGPVGAHGAVDVAGLAPPLLRRHRAPAQRVDVGAVEHQRGAHRQPRRVHRDAPQGRRRPLVRRTRGVRHRRGARGRRREPAAAGAHGDLRRRRPPAQRPVLLPARGRGGGREQQRRARPGDLLRLHHAAGRRHRQRHPHLAPAPVRAHRAHRSPRRRPGERPHPGRDGRDRRVHQGAPGLAVRRPRMAPALQPLHEPGRAQRFALAAAERPRHLRRPHRHPARRRRPGAPARLLARALPEGRPVDPARVPHAVPADAEPPPRRRPPQSAHLVRPGRHPPGGRLGRGQAARLRPRPVLRRTRPRRHPRGPRPQCPVARLRHLRRRLLPARLRAPQGPGRRPPDHRPAVRLHARRGRARARARQRHGTLPDRPVGAHHRRDDRRPAAHPQGRRGHHDRELGVGTVQPGAEPRPRPGRLPGDAPLHLRLRPHPEPVPDGPRPGDPAGGVPQRPGALPGERRHRLRLSAQRHLLVPEGDRVRGRDPQRDPGRAELLRHRLPDRARRRARPHYPAHAAVRARGRPRTPRPLRRLRAVAGGPQGDGRLRPRSAELAGRHSQLAPERGPLPGRVAEPARPPLPARPHARTAGARTGLTE